MNLENGVSWDVPVQLVLRDGVVAILDPEPATLQRNVRSSRNEEQSVAAWMFDLLQDIRHNNYLLVAAVAHPKIRCGQASNVVVSCGDGYDILVMFHKHAIPQNAYDPKTIPRVRVYASLADSSWSDSAKFVEEEHPHKHYGDLDCGDSLLAHMKAQLREPPPIMWPFVAPPLRAPVTFRIYLDIESDLYVPIQPTDDRGSKAVFRYSIDHDNWCDIRTFLPMGRTQRVESFDSATFSAPPLQQPEESSLDDSEESANIASTSETQKETEKEDASSSSEEESSSTVDQSLSEEEEPPQKRIRLSISENQQALVDAAEAYAAALVEDQEDRAKSNLEEESQDNSVTSQETESSVLVGDQPSKKKTALELETTSVSSAEDNEDPPAKSDLSPLDDHGPASSLETSRSTENVTAVEVVNKEPANEENTAVVAIPLAKSRTAEGTENADTGNLPLGEEPRCYYFPFCMSFSKDCGGIQKGHCNNVKSGNIKLPPKNIFKAAKKAAISVVQNEQKHTTKEIEKAAGKAEEPKNEASVHEKKTDRFSNDKLVDNDATEILVRVRTLKIPVESSVELGQHLKESSQDTRPEMKTDFESLSTVSVEVVSSSKEQPANARTDVELQSESGDSPMETVDNTDDDNESYDMSKQDKVVRLFEGLADQWDKICMNYSAAVYKVLWSMTGLDPSTRPLVVVDFGCGTGVLTGLMRRSCSKILAIDATPKMIKVLEKKKRAEADWNNVHTLCAVVAETSEDGTPHDLSEWQGKADLVVATRTMTYIPEENLDETMKAIGRLLKPGGIFCHSDPPLSSLQFQPKLSKRKAESMYTMAGGLETVLLNEVTLDLGDGTVDELIGVARKS